MSASVQLKKALDLLGLPYVEEFYYGKESLYIIWQEGSASDTEYADNEPVEETTSLTVQITSTDTEQDTRLVRKKLEKILRKHGFYVTNKEHITNKGKDPESEYVKDILYISYTE